MSAHVNALSPAAEAEDEHNEIQCKRCHGTGEDRDGADCLHCEGYGTVLT